MSADLMMAALADEAMSDTDGDDGSHKDHTDCDEMPGCVAAVSHKVVAVSQVMHAECGAAVSQEECALVAKTFSVENKKDSPMLCMLVIRRRSARPNRHLCKQQILTECINAYLLMASAFRCGPSICTKLQRGSSLGSTGWKRG